jgi:hypothetical protein
MGTHFGGTRKTLEKSDQITHLLTPSSSRFVDPRLLPPFGNVIQLCTKAVMHSPDTDSMLHSRTPHTTSSRPHPTHNRPLCQRLHAASMASGAPVQYRVRAASLSSSQRSQQAAAAGVSLQHGQELDDAFSGLDPAGTGLMTVAGFGSLLSQRSARTTFPDLQNFRPGRVRRGRSATAPTQLLQQPAKLPQQQLTHSTTCLPTLRCTCVRVLYAAVWLQACVCTHCRHLFPERHRKPRHCR